MLRQCTRVSRISGPATHQIRPHLTPYGARHPTRRPFTRKPALQSLSPPLNRPQLSFLSPSPTSRALPPLSVHLRQHFGRLISTERRNYYKRRVSRTLRIALSLGAIVALFEVIKLGVHQEELEHRWPTPPEWSWKSRWALRAVQAQQNPEEIGKLMTDWGMVAGILRELLARLEDTQGEGKGILEQDDGGLFIEGVGKAGFDISAKSEPWRRGYFQALMGAARAAENLEGWVTDWKQRISGPAEYVVGPSNPHPKQPPGRQKRVMHEEDCKPASPSPEVFYMKILTTRGFDTRQKVDAALAYADWLDYKGLQSTAADMYTWAMDIAAAGSTVDASKVVDVKTGIIKNDGQAMPSENILRVSTALAVHHARYGNLPTALSIFTSVLKARRALPPAPPGTVSLRLPSLSNQTNDPFRSLYNSLKTVLVPVEYPPPPPSGNEPPLRTAASTCEEAGLMTYIGEIIFASSSKETGLAWTRDAVDQAETVILEEGGTPRHRCAECLRVGLENWKTMVSRLVTEAQRKEQETLEKAKTSWLGPSQKQIEAKTTERKRWEAEGMILDDRIRRLRPMIEAESGLDAFAPNSSLLV